MRKHSRTGREGRRRTAVGPTAWCVRCTVEWFVVVGLDGGGGGQWPLASHPPVGLAGEARQN